MTLQSLSKPVIKDRAKFKKINCLQNRYIICVNDAIKSLTFYLTIKGQSLKDGFNFWLRSPERIWILLLKNNSGDLFLDGSVAIVDHAN